MLLFNVNFLSDFEPQTKRQVLKLFVEGHVRIIKHEHFPFISKVDPF